MFNDTWLRKRRVLKAKALLAKVNVEFDREEAAEFVSNEISSWDDLTSAQLKLVGDVIYKNANWKFDSEVELAVSGQEPVA